MKLQRRICRVCNGERFLIVANNRHQLCPACDGDGCKLHAVIQTTEKGFNKLQRDMAYWDKVSKRLGSGGRFPRKG